MEREGERERTSFVLYKAFSFGNYGGIGKMTRIKYEIKSKTSMLEFD